MNKHSTFVEITNLMIYERLVAIEKKLDYTNGKVKLNRWIATTALSLITVMLSALSIKLIGAMVT